LFDGGENAETVSERGPNRGRSAERVRRLVVRIASKKPGLG
jgi:hypothetical protein